MTLQGLWNDTGGPAGPPPHLARRSSDGVPRRPQGAGPVGPVSIVGAGPGDPDLLTVKAVRVLAEAQVVVHDELIGPRIFDLLPPTARRIATGKRGGGRAVPQHEINAILAREALAGRRVVRLKGGDPFVFGRGGEELAYLRARAIPVEIVPGVTAALGCAAALGMPLTHRDAVSAVTFIAGHRREDAETSAIAGLALHTQTVVVYMGRRRAAALRDELLAKGLSPSTPVALIENGTLPDQRTSFGELYALAALAERHGDGPTLIVAGEVVRMAEGWRAPAPVAIAAW